MPSEQAAWASVPYNYGPRCRAKQADRIAEDIERRLGNPFNEQAYRAQLLAASLHNCYRRLSGSARRRWSSTALATGSSRSPTRT